MKTDDQKQEVDNLETEESLPENEEQEKIDKLMRALAEKENRCKVIERERDISVKYAVTNVVTDFLEIIDALDSAVQASSDKELTGDALTLREGLMLTRSLVSKVLNKHDVQEIFPNPGDEFDHDAHQAMSQESSEGYEAGRVLSCLRRGFKLKERLLRPAFVVVVGEQS